jgi:hypothetical protein
MKRELRGVVTHVLVGENRDTVEHDPDAMITVVRWSVRVTMEGFDDDKHAGLTRLSDVRTPHYPLGTEIRNNRQVSIVSTEESTLIAAAIGVPTVLPQWLGANLVLQHIPALTYLPPSTRLFFPGDTVLVVEGENMPCLFPGKVLQRQYPDIPGLAPLFPKAAIHRRGVVAWVERPGTICAADAVRVCVPPQVIYSFAPDGPSPRRGTAPAG